MKPHCAGVSSSLSRSVRICHPKEKKGLSMSLETISRYFLLLFFMAFLLYETVCLRELLLSSFDRGGGLHKKNKTAPWLVTFPSLSM